MNAPAAIDSVALGCVTVSYRPDLAVLRRQLLALPADSAKIIVDNGSPAEALIDLAALCSELPQTWLLCNKRNLGLAAALNRGVAAIRQHRPSARYALLLDQDSEPQPGSVEQLLSAYAALVAAGEPVGCVGPNLLDADTGLSHGFHRGSRWRWRRVYPVPGSLAPVACTNLNGSGSLLPIDLFERLGGLDEAFFIDHIDTDWSFRVLAAGYSLWGIPAAGFLHRMGEQGLRYWCFGWRVWPSRSPQRHYYLFRNAMRLMRRPYVHKVWKFWALIKLMLTAFIHGIFGSDRSAHRAQILRALRDTCQKR